MNLKRAIIYYNVMSYKLQLIIKLGNKWVNN